MKKYVTFLVCFAVSLSAWATPQTQSLRVGDLVQVNQSKDIFNSYMKSRPALMKSELKYQRIDANTVIVFHNGEEVKFEKVNDNSLKLNGKLVVIEKTDTPETFLKKMNTAYTGSSYKASILDMLFFGTAHADVTLSLAALFFGGAILTGLGFWLGRITSPFRPRVVRTMMVPAMTSTQYAEQVQQTTETSTSEEVFN